MITAETYRSQFEGNGVAIEFAFGFPVRDKDHVLVTKTVAGVDTTLVVDVDYTVNGVDSADPADWSIAYPISGDPLASGELLTIVPNLPLKQLTNFGNQAAFFAENHERAFDYLTLLSQQNREILDRCVRLPVGTDEDAADVLATLDSAIAAASLSAATSTAAAASSAASSALAEAAAEGVGVVRGLASTALPSGLTTLTAGISKLCQKFTGTLSGAATINLTRTGAVEGSLFRIRLAGVGVSAANSLTIQEHAAGSLLVWNEDGTLTGTLTFIFNGTSWELWEGSINLA